MISELYYRTPLFPEGSLTLRFYCIYISHKSQIEQPSVGLASLAQLFLYTIYMVKFWQDQLSARFN